MSNLPPLPPTRDEAAAECGRLAGELMQSLRRYRQAKQTYAAVTAAYGRKHGRGTADAEFAANSDPRRRQSVADAEWHRNEVLVAATAMQALRPYAHREH